MTARILIVDDSPANAALLQALLTSEYYEVVIAQDGPEAFARLAESQPDLVLLDAVMPGVDGFEVCRRIKASSESTHLPVVIVTSLDAAHDRISALQSGADEFLTKPLEPITLLAVVRSVVREKRMVDELRTHTRAGNDAGEEPDDANVLDERTEGSRVLVIADDRERADDLRFALAAHHQVHVERDPDDALLLVRRAEFDLIAVDLALASCDGMRVCSRLRSLEETRRTPLLAVAREHNVEARALALDVGANGVVGSPVDPMELLARVEACVRRKRYADRLRKSVRRSIERAVVDPLTSMHNRRYLQRHLGPLVAQNVERGRPVSLLIMDVDHFKTINDTWGHEVGDQVLCEMARRIASGVRGLDLCCRFGGEEFVAAFAGVDAPTAQRIAERLRDRIASDPFPVTTETGPLSITISVGVATTSSREDNAELLLRRADLALYRAKKEGRNRVVSGA